MNDAAPDCNRHDNVVNGFEAHEAEPLPERRSVELVALRRNPDTSAARLRTSVPEVLAGIIREVPRATLELGMRTDVNGMVSIGLTAAAGEATDAVVAEIAAVLQPVAETEVTSGQDVTGGCVAWPVTPDTARGRLGFAVGAATVGVNVMSWRATRDVDEPDELVEVLAALPGQGVRVRLRAVPEDTRRWEAQLAVLTAGEQPALRLRAALRRRVPGVQVAWAHDDAPVWLQIQSADLARVLAIPVSGPHPLAGMYTGMAAPIAVAPDRHGTEDGADPGVRIGHALTGGGQALPVGLTVRERLRHVHVLGRTGTGKSSVLAAIARGIADGPGGALIADPHGQLCDRVLAETPDAARDRLWLIRCGDVDNAVPMNPLALTDPVRRDIAINEVCASFQYLFDKKATGIVGPRFQERVAMALRALAAVQGPRASLLDVPVALADDAFMNAAVNLCGDDRVVAWWNNDKIARRSGDYGEVVSWVNSKFEAFAATAAIRAILGSGIDAIDFAAAMDAGRIILVDLSKAQLGEAASRLLGYLYLTRVWSAALQRTNPARPFTVIVDEAHTLISGALTNMLAEGRKFGISVVLAHQYLEQLDDDLRPAVDGNVATTITFRCAVSDAADIYKRFGGLVDASVLMTLPDLTAICLRTATPGPTTHPHTLVVDHNSRTPGRAGTNLQSHTQAVVASTHAELANPHRDVTTAAARGVSNVTTIRPAGRPDSTARPRAPKPAHTAPADRVPAASAAIGSFLEEWPKCREQLTQRESDSAAGEPVSSNENDGQLP